MKESEFFSIGEIYAQLPIFAAMERKQFGDLKVLIRRSEFADAAREVEKTRGTFGLASFVAVAERKAGTNSAIQILATMVNRPDDALFTQRDGPSNVLALKGQEIAIPQIGGAAHLFVLKTLRSAGLSEKDVRFIVAESSSGGPTAVLANWVSAGRVNAAPLSVAFRRNDPKFTFKSIAGPQGVTMPTWVLYASTQTLDQEREQVSQMIRGLENGIKLVKSDRELTRTILKEQFKFTEDNARQFLEFMFLIDPAIIKPNVKELFETAELMRSVGAIKGTPTLADPEKLDRLF